MIQEIEAAQIWDRPLVTIVEPLDTFYIAEEYHQEYFKKNPYTGYCRAVVAPKVTKFRQKFAARFEKMSEKQVLLVVLAHPDDESFGTGGTIAYYAKRGVDVHLVCATRGEAGEVAPEFLQGFSSIADLRVSELRCAAGILGLKGVHFLDYRDLGMSGSADNQHPQALINAPLEEVAAKVARLVRKLQPQVLITFDPIGGYKHPDHIAIHKAAVRAFRGGG